MTGVDAIQAVNAAQSAQGAQGAQRIATVPESAGFGDMIAQGVAQMEARIDRANDLVRSFAVDDSIPVHEVTIALEEARIGVELAMQVRSRVVEAYREIMNMQL